jgi:hypothetical protein
LERAATGAADGAFTKLGRNVPFLMLINAQSPRWIERQFALWLHLPSAALQVGAGRYVMAQKEPRMSAKSTLPDANPAELAEMGKKQMDAMINVHRELIDAIEEVNGEWAARLKAEADLATEFAGKLTAAKSIPETAAICQEWMGRRMGMFAEDSRRFAAGIQKFTTTTAGLLPTGWRGGSS